MNRSQTKPAPKAGPRVGMVSLGCPKALVDSERILTRLRAEGYEISPSYEGADVVMVNTCGFIDSAKAESFEAIGEAMAENGKVIVTGCMGLDEEGIREIYPGVLAVTGPQQYENVVEAVHRAIPPQHDPYSDLVPPEGIKLTPRHYAYLKISEGCNHRCSFCIIPSLRGDLVSRPAAEILDEAEKLAIAGVRELLVISQDTGAYGQDLKHAGSDWHGRMITSRMPELFDALGDLGIWVRLHYAYPYPMLDEMIPLMARGKILPYIDAPFQHAAPNVLKAMKRPAFEAKTLGRIKSWREQIPDLTVRSTFIVGFPGETEEDFQYLLNWLEEAQLDRVGCFKYEAVDGAVANSLDGAVPEEVKQERWERFMEAQKAISSVRLKAKVGKTLEVLVDEVDEEGAIARSYADSPEIDGCVFINGETELQPGDMLEVKVDNSDEYDLWASPVKDDW